MFLIHRKNKPKRREQYTLFYKAAKVLRNETQFSYERNAVPYMDLCFLKDKTSIDADLYIDDSPTNIERFEQEDKNYIIFNNSTNKHCNGPRAMNWDEVYDMVIQAMHDKKMS